MTDLFHDTNFWVLISFVIFCVMAYRYGRQSVLDMIDSKIEAIRTELAEAETLRVEAQSLLTEYQKKHKNAMAEADQIIADAKKHADALRQKAEADMTLLKQRREDQLQDRLNRLEQTARQDVEAYTADISLRLVEALLKDKITAKDDKALIATMMDNVPKTLN